MPSPTPPTKKKPSVTTQSLRNQGFDGSYYNRESGYHKIRCSQCEALVINGYPCHETGCPNPPRSREN